MQCGLGSCVTTVLLSTPNSMWYMRWSPYTSDLEITPHRPHVQPPWGTLPDDHGPHAQVA